MPPKQSQTVNIADYINRQIEVWLRNNFFRATVTGRVNFTNKIRRLGQQVDDGAYLSTIIPGDVGADVAVMNLGDQPIVIGPLSRDQYVGNPSLLYRSSDVVTVTGTVAETNLQLVTIPANTLLNQRGLRISIVEDARDPVGTGNGTLKLYYGATLLATTLTGGNDPAPYRLAAQGNLYGVSATQQFFSWEGQPGFLSAINYSLTTEDPTVAKDLKLTVTPLAATAVNRLLHMDVNVI